MSTTVGILGGGQLGWMLSESIFKYGGTPKIYAHGRSLACDRVPGTAVGNFGDSVALQNFMTECDVVTIEVEHVDCDALQPFADKLMPSLDVIRLAQDRSVEKDFLRTHGLPHAEFKHLKSTREARMVRDELTFPLIMKTARGGYDGRGQAFLKSPSEFDAALEDLRDDESLHVVVEEPIDIVAEASVVVARSASGHCRFPVFENIHRNHVLDTTSVPSSLSGRIQESLIELAWEAAEKMNLDGLLTTEFFISKTPGRAAGASVDGHWVFVNEFAPRPHNSGHITRNATTLSQFDVLARTLLGLDPGAPEVLVGNWCMVNLLGELWGETFDLSNALADRPEMVDVVLYGKEPTRPGRKMGHAVSRSSSHEGALEAAINFRRALGGS